MLNTNNDPSLSEGEQINEIYASVAPPIVRHLTFNMNHPMSGGDRNHKYVEHTQSTSGVTNHTNSSINNALKNPVNTGSNLNRGVSIQNTHPKVIWSLSQVWSRL